MRRNPSLDGLRAFAVLAVLASHSGVARATGGWIGVDVFFVLSGFLISDLLLGEWRSTGRIDLRAFYLRRALRLYPALVLMVLACAPFAAWFGAGGRPGGYPLTALLALSYTEDLFIGVTNGFGGSLGHTWSLSIEEQFYLIWPVVLIVCLRRGRRPGTWAAVGALVSTAVLLLAPGRIAPGPVPAGYYLPHTRAFELLIGCVLAAAPPRWRDRPPRGVGAGAAGVGLVGLGTLMLAVGRGGGQGTQHWFGVQAIVAAGLSALAVGGLVAAPASLPARAVGWGPLARLGLISYGLYLYHLPVIIIGGHLMHWRASVETAVELPVAVALAAASFALVERPVQRRFAPRGAPAPVPVPRHAARRGHRFPGRREAVDAAGIILPAGPEPLDTGHSAAAGQFR